MHSTKRLALLATGLLAMSLVFYGAHLVIFKDLHHVLIYGLGELAFLPIEVLLVTLVIDRLLEASEKKNMLNKLNMVIGTFFSEVGTGFMLRVFSLDKNFENIKKNFIVTGDWNDKTYAATKNSLAGYQYRIYVSGDDLVDMKEFLVGKRDFLLRLLENPNLLEHEAFSDVLWTVFHLTEELSARDDVTKLSDGDYNHIAIDTKRAYVAVLSEWLDYMKHLQKAYPYMFMLAIRMNPFDPDAKAELP